MTNPSFTLYTDRLGEWRFRFVCEEGIQRLRASEGYNAKVNVLKAIDSVRRNAIEEKRYDFKQNSRGKFFFTIKARNGNTLAVSRNHSELDLLETDAEVIAAQTQIAPVYEEGKAGG